MSVADVMLFAWVGEDEFGSGEIGLKQAHVPAGLIPLVAVRQDKVEKLWPQLEAQARRYGKRIRLVRFRFDAVIRETEAGE